MHGRAQRLAHARDHPLGPRATFVVEVKGRNGLKVDNVLKPRNSVEDLKNGTLLETGGFAMKFSCPEDFDGAFKL